MSFPQHSNLGGMIAARPDDHTWLVEITPGGGERRFSYGELRELSGRVAQTLHDRGLAPGARVALLGGNRAEYLLSYYGIMQAGMCPVPIGVKLPTETVEHILADAAVEFLIGDAAQCLKFEGRLPTWAFDQPESWRAALAPQAMAPVPCAPGAFATILYTSGSTGVPKGVPLTHGGYIWTLQQVVVNGGSFMQETGARVLTAAPLSHMNALFLAKTVTAYGATLVLLTHFNARAYLQAAAHQQCAIVTAVPTMLALCARETDTWQSLDLSVVVNVAMGSAPVTDALFEQVAQMFPNAQVQNGWGTTETGPAVFGPHPHGKLRPRLALGYPLPDVEVKLAGGAHPDEGELWVRNGAIMPGYLNRPEDTALRLVDGWYRTGDVMRRDADGFYYFVSRADDMFVCGGENIYPGEVETLLERHPAVAQAAVVPVPDELKGEVPAAFVVLRPAAEISAEALKQYALERGPVYAHPRFIRFVNQLPLSAANKIDRQQIRQWASDLRR